MNRYDLTQRHPADNLTDLRDCLRAARSASKERASMRVDGGTCIVCGHSHGLERRLQLLRRLVGDGVERETIHAEYPCLWPDDDGGRRLLARDLAAIRREP